jgi:hypothetical protein
MDAHKFLINRINEELQNRGLHRASYALADNFPDYGQFLDELESNLCSLITSIPEDDNVVIATIMSIITRAKKKYNQIEQCDQVLTASQQEHERHQRERQQQQQQQQRAQAQAQYQSTSFNLPSYSRQSQTASLANISIPPSPALASISTIAMTQQPTTYQQQPTTYQQQPTTYQPQPTTYQQQPTTYQQQRQQPLTSTQPIPATTLHAYRPTTTTITPAMAVTWSPSHTPATPHDMLFSPSHDSQHALASSTSTSSSPFYPSSSYDVGSVSETQSSISPDTIQVPGITIDHQLMSHDKT